MFLTILLLTIIVIGLCFAGIGIKMFIKKDGSFERRCENEGSAHCSCGGKGSGTCRNEGRCQRK